VPTITKKQKTHGFLPLFLSQFLLLLATVGVGAALFVLPESKWKEAQEAILTFLQSFLLPFYLVLRIDTEL
jgi:hypothetical protein